VPRDPVGERHEGNSVVPDRRLAARQPFVVQAVEPVRQGGVLPPPDPPRSGHRPAPGTLAQPDAPGGPAGSAVSDAEIEEQVRLIRRAPQRGILLVGCPPRPRIALVDLFVGVRTHEPGRPEILDPERAADGHEPRPPDHPTRETSVPLPDPEEGMGSGVLQGDEHEAAVGELLRPPG
jgi:hypothetical protein